MSETQTCRYNRNHKVKTTRLLAHEHKCPDRKTSNLVLCPYNICHKISILNIEKHKQICPDRPQIDKDVHDEMMAYLDSLNSQKPAVSKPSSNDSSLLKLENSPKRKSTNYSDYTDDNLFSLGEQNGMIEYNDEDDTSYAFDQDDTDTDYINGVYIMH